MDDVNKPVLIVRSVFCPNDTYFKTTFNNIYNLILFLRYLDQPIKYDVYIVGFTKKTYMKDLCDIININKDLFNKITFDLWILNYGKYRIINEINKIIKETEYIGVFYTDHDIIMTIPDYDKFFFKILISAINVTIDNKKIGLIALNQKHDVRHQHNIYENAITINNNIFVYPTIHENTDNFTSSIASGAFFVASEHLKKIQDLELKTTYGLDDYHLIKSLYTVGVVSIVSKNIYVEHPFNNDKEYNQWKIDKIHKLLKKGDKDQDYYNDIEQSHNFWNNTIQR